MKISARNQLKGKVKKMVKGDVNTEIVIELPGGQEIISVITTSSAQKLDLKEEKPCYAIIKASSVMVGID